jgi:hypothetical protein
MRKALLVLALVLILVMSFAGAALADPPVHANNDGDVDFLDHAPSPDGPYGHCFGHDAVAAARSAGDATHANYKGGVKAFVAVHADLCGDEEV